MSYGEYPITARQIKVMLMRELLDVIDNDTLSDFTIAQHMAHILRTKQVPKPCYDWSDNDLLISLQAYRRELLSGDLEDEPISAIGEVCCKRYG